MNKVASNGLFYNVQSYRIYKNLAWLNELPNEEAGAVFRDCCGSDEWVRQMVDARPFPLVESLYAAAENIWFALASAEQRKAYAAPRPTDPTKPNTVAQELAEASCLYKAKFGFIFTVSPSGKGANEILAICRARLGNSAETELQIAAEEQRKITEIRLNNLLER